MEVFPPTVAEPAQVSLSSVKLGLRVARGKFHFAVVGFPKVVSAHRFVIVSWNPRAVFFVMPIVGCPVGTQDVSITTADLCRGHLQFLARAQFARLEYPECVWSWTEYNITAL